MVAQGKKKVLAVLPPGGPAADNKEYLDCKENGLGLREWLEKQGHEFVSTANKEGPDSELARNLKDTNILITTPFHPAYVTPELLKDAKCLELVITAGVGSDHIDLHAAADKGITVAEVTSSNVVSVAEDIVMRVLIHMRNYLPAWEQIKNGEWDVAAVAGKARDLEAKTIGTVGGGRIGWEMMKRLQGFDAKLLYYARSEKEAMDKLGCTWVKELPDLLGQCDVVAVNTPLTDKTRGMFNKDTIGKMKKGAYLINTARGAICDRQAVVDACKSGQLGGYSGDVWDQQPPGKDHPWRYMPNSGMTPHISGTTLDAQKRVAAGTKEMLDCWFNGRPFQEDYYIVREGQLAEQYT